MKIKLNECIRANGIKYLPPSVVDTDAIGITAADAQVLVRRGTATLVDEPVTGTLAGVVEESGAVVPLAEMTKADLVALACDIGLDVTGKTKAQLVELIGAQQVQG